MLLYNYMQRDAKCDAASSDAKLLNLSEDVVKKVFLCLDTNTAPGTENILARYFKECQKVLTLLLKNKKNSSIKPSSFSKKSKITQINQYSKRLKN